MFVRVLGLEWLLFLPLACGGGGGLPTVGVPTPDGATDDGGTLEASGDDSSSVGTDTGPPPPLVDAFTGAPAFTAGTGMSHHNGGTNCTGSDSCHGGGAGSRAFLIGGTVFSDYKGTVPAVGVEVRARDMTGKAVSVYTGSDGDFWIHSSGATLALPLLVGARDGVTTRPMITTIGVAAMGGCASPGCHIVGGSPKSGAYYAIHVP